MSGAGRERTLAIGMYPAGASAQGVHDLAGNVWEWRMNQYNTPSEKAVDGSRIDRVVRGGSWYNAQHLARADGRYNHHPDDRYDFFGFRVVCASPIL